MFSFIEGYHNTSPISVMSTNMRLRLKNRIKGIADKVTEGLNLEKETWNCLDDAETYVENMKTEIDAAVQDAV